MKRFLLSSACAAAVLGTTFLVGTTSTAAPELSQKSCAAGGDAFSQGKGTKTCTRTETVVVTSNQTRTVVSLDDSTPSVLYSYEGAYERTSTTQTTTIRSQKASGPIVTSTTEMSSVSITPTACTRVQENLLGEITRESVDISECQRRGVYPT